jgi:UDP-glucose 4-epimerase
MLAAAAKARLRVLVTGGAGYIGSHILHHLADAGHEPIALDNLYSGHRWAVGEHRLLILDLTQRYELERLFREQSFDAVVHCAAHIWVGESVRNPAKYYANNVGAAVHLFEMCAQAKVKYIVFSSTAAVYGEPVVAIIDEDTLPKPINPYGSSKLMAERVLTDIAGAHGMRYAILRYFNVAGADSKLRVGEATPDNTHLVKVACETAIGRRSKMHINGTDYPTPDGTCIRDYIHVDDLAHAHIQALSYLMDSGESFTANCGYGHGYSVREVLTMVREVTGVAFNLTEGPRRQGDPPELVADAHRIRTILSWGPRHDDLEYIVRTAWEWEQKLGGRNDLVAS